MSDSKSIPTERYSSEEAFRYQLTSQIPVCDVDTLPVVNLARLKQAIATTARRTSPICELGASLQRFGLVLIHLHPTDFPNFDSASLRPFLTSERLEAACDRIFGRPDVLVDYFNQSSRDGTEVGFYSFPLNSPSGGLRGSRIVDYHKGLPFSLIWNHNAIANPYVPEFGYYQSVLQKYITLYREITHVVVEALMIYFGDNARLLRAIVSPQTHHRGNHLKLIHSAGASLSSHLEEDRTTGMISRHRVHVDHSVFTLNPPTMLSSTQNGRLFYMSNTLGHRQWRPLSVPIAHVAIFGGSDLATFTQGTTYEIPGLPHQVLATRQEALKPRSSVLYRVTIDPDAPHLYTLSGRGFSFHGQPTPFGAEYYRAVFEHRRGY